MCFTGASVDRPYDPSNLHYRSTSCDLYCFVGFAWIQLGFAVFRVLRGLNGYEKDSIINFHYVSALTY